ncbi:NAD(P)-dependent oxidoreductase [Crenobacter intestini]|uniref:NAD(P)-dependent oxidoreductase n=1 Tax=Crenobacter intestini TaxID=2563443 RepID=A0A4T0V3B8_9NEIS|nr:NAD(P)-binding domain-containing protein [Crenobacter intestini]TIC85999.1 NAD(P)-dependent oxidoreductase [Crenobacter intestini]
MHEVSVIGLGAMGSALAHVMCAAGWQVTVWNRSADKARALQAQGARVAGTAAQALAASPLTLICVDNYPASLSTLETAQAAVSGRLLVQLSTGAPQGARELEAWAHAHGASYLDGAILAFPEQMGTADASIIASGAEAAFRAAEPCLRQLAPALDYLGTAVGAASAQDCAVATYFAGGLIGALHGALICEAEGLPVDAFCAQLAELSPILGGDVRHLGATLARGEFDAPYASLKTWSAAITRLRVHAESSGINADFPSFAAALFERGVAAGYGAQEVSALIKVLRAQG